MDTKSDCDTELGLEITNRSFAKKGEIYLMCFVMYEFNVDTNLKGLCVQLPLRRSIKCLLQYQVQIEVVLEFIHRK